MVVKLVPKFNAAQIKKMIAQKVAAIDAAILSRLQRIGETFVYNARSVNTYKDQTGNLRSSIGYVILKDGRQKFANFDGKTGEGTRKAKAMAKTTAAKFPTGYVLICVAGMDYAAAVESRGLDVITGSSKLAEAQLKTAIRELSKKVARL